MKPQAINVPFSVVTEKTARGYLEQSAAIIYANGFDLIGSDLFTDAAERIVRAGYLTWEECDEIEAAAVGREILDTEVINGF